MSDPSGTTKPLTPTRRIFIGLGSNLGDRRATLQAALDALRQIPGTTDWTVSAIYETPAVAMAADETSPPDFLNAVAAATSGRPAPELLAELQAIEAAMGRTDKGQHRSRTLDLDLLACGDEVLTLDETRPLQVPHPRLHERWFVLRPFADVAPDWRHPQRGQTVAEMLAELDDPQHRATAAGEEEAAGAPGRRHAAGLV